jgi:exopolyphosphatase
MEILNHIRQIKSLHDGQTNTKLKKLYVLNNDSCDMDSFLSAIILSVSRNLKKGTLLTLSEDLNTANNNPKYEPNPNAESIYMPLMNCKRGELKTRLDINFLIQKFKLNENDLFYINDEAVINDLNNSLAELILVDHNTLHPSQISYSHLVMEIIDHHNDNSINSTLFKNLKRKNLKFPLGSCSTLIILDSILCDKYCNQIMTQIFDPLFLISAILLDTDNFKKELYLNRWVDLDFYVYEKMIFGNSNESLENISKIVNDYFNKLANSKYDEDGNLSLGVENLMNKDKKSFKWGNFNCEWSSLQIPLKSITKNFGWNSVVDYFENCRIANQNISIYITLSVYPNSGMKILTIYDYQNRIDIFDLYNFLNLQFLEKLTNVKLKKNYGNKIIKVYLDKTFSRKLLEPIMNKYFEKLN